MSHRSFEGVHYWTAVAGQCLAHDVGQRAVVAEVFDLISGVERIRVATTVCGPSERRMCSRSSFIPTWILSPNPPTDTKTGVAFIPTGAVWDGTARRCHAG